MTPVAARRWQFEPISTTTLAAAGDLVLLGRDEARFPMVPTPTATPGGKGHRPVVGTRDCKHLLYVFAVVNLVTAAAPADVPEGQQDARESGLSKCRRSQAALAAHLRHVGRMCSADRHPRVVMLIGNAPGAPANPCGGRWPTVRTWR